MNKTLWASLLATICVSCTQQPVEEPYRAEWSSLARHHTPQWVMDAKFGIYTHWGHQTAFKVDPNQKMDMFEGFEAWKGEQFDAAAWAQLFKDAGAQFAGTIAQHGSGCLNWDSEISEWNSVNYGPKVDILGELEPEIRKRGMKVMASFHSLTCNSIWGRVSRNNATELPAKSFTKDAYDRQDTQWLEGFVDRIDEATTKYGLDLIWFDTSFGRTIAGDLRGFIQQGKYKPEHPRAVDIGGYHEGYQQQIIANYYNLAQAQNRDVEVVYKSYDIPNNIGMRDIENGNLDGMQYDPWMTDVSILGLPEKKWTEVWFWGENQPIKDANFLVDMLIDVTSKNGRMLLNVPPKLDGTFDDRIKHELLDMGAWLKVNGEGIYGSTPWCIYGEGETVIKHPGHHGQTQAWGKEMAHFSAGDIRYTTKGRDIYAFVLGKPASLESRFMALGAMQKLYPGEVKKVELLGSNLPIKWSHEDNYLAVHLPAGVEEQPAYCFRISR